MISPQRYSTTLLVPDPDLLKLLRGTVVQNRHVLSQKPATRDQYVDVHLVTEGVGMLGLTDYRDSLEWAGINNNIWRTARVATYLACLLNEAGVQVNTQLVFDTMLVFKLGRRRWDEAMWYPQVVLNAQAIQGKGDTPITLEILEKAGCCDSLLETVGCRQLSMKHYPVERMDTLEKQICMYADFRTGQVVTSLQERFDDLSRRGRAPQEDLDYLQAWAFKAEQEIFAHLAIRPEDITNESPSMPYWEQVLRNAYLQDAEVSAFAHLQRFAKRLTCIN